MVRVRNLVLAIAAASALTSEMAYALGLGEVTLKSALNQPLVAEIELLDAKSFAPGEVVPVLASAEDFNRAGVDRQYFLTDLKFTPVLRPDGKSVIQVSSSKPVREPYLNFLVEVIWPSGRLLREYTLLLDPPLYSPETTAAVAPQLPVAAPAPRPATTPRAASASARPASSVSSAASTQQANEYKTTANDTLWEIAERNRHGGTVHQTMLAIQDLNSDAFIDGNINRMKSGQVLRLPNGEQIASRSQSEAIQEVSRQNASWRQGIAGTAGARQLDATERSSAGAAPTRSETGDSLRLVAPEAGKATTGSDGGTGNDEQALRDKLAIAQESLDSSRRENVDLQDRLSDLQSQLDKLQRLMQLKDDQLAKLQAQLANGAGAEAGAAGTETEMPGATAPSESATGSAQGEPESDQANEPAAQGERSTPVVDPAPAISPAPAQSAKEGSALPKPKSVPVAPEPAEPDSFIKDLMGNTLLLAAIGGSALLLLLIGLMALSRRNAMREAELQESLLADSLPDNLYAADERHAVELPEEEPAARSDVASPNAVDPLADAGNDPLAEADIYIAYGRFNQAAELLQNALNDEPQRSDLRLKLMEVYAELGNRDGFRREETELREIGGSAAAIDQLKLKYPAMAAAGFAAAGAAASANNNFDNFDLDDLTLDEPAPATAVQDEDDSFGLSLDDLELGSPETPVSDGDSLGLDDLNFDDLVAAPAETSQPADDFSFELDDTPSSSTASLDDDLGELSLDLDDDLPAAAPAPEAAPAAAATSLIESDFDFDLPEASEPEASLNDEFDLSLDLDAGEPESDNLTNQLEGVEAELNDLSRDLDAPVQGGSADSADEMGEDFDFLSDTDETTTKLDLARAYIDMGDAEGARDILDEVITEGSDVQQQEAREMLAKLA